FRFYDGTDRGIHTIKSALREINRQKCNSSMDKMGLYATHRKTSLVLGLVPSNPGSSEDTCTC
ncbi:MAG: hypothetical protein VST71_04210, partial [Nitrospirota bacterium]|nr:hypothetical protein [Nitrospirota bacterium]